MAFDRQSPPAPAAPAGVVEDQRLSAVIQDLKQASAEYHAEYFGHFLNEQQVDAARSEIAKMGTAAAHLYDHWQRSRDALPTSAEIGAVVDPLTFRSRLSQFMPRRLAEDDGTPDKGSRFTRLANLNERVRQAAEEITEALPMLRDQVLYARHFEQNCMRLYRGEDRESERLQDAEDLRLTVEQTLQNIQGDVDSLRSQTQSLTLYAQMHLAIQVQILTGIVLVVTVAGVIAAFIQ